MKKKKELKSKDALALALVAGAGIGAYFLWKYFKEKDPPPINPGGFNISKLYYEQEGEMIDFPIPGREFDIVIIAVNKSRTETITGYCDIINLDTEETIFSETVTVEPITLKTFIHTMIMPETTLNVVIKTGRIIDSEKIVDHIWPLEIIPGEKPIIVEIKSTIFSQKI